MIFRTKNKTKQNSIEECERKHIHKPLSTNNLNNEFIFGILVAKLKIKMGCSSQQ